jgi:hypothetical protein
MPDGMDVPHGRNFPFHGDFQDSNVLRPSHFPLAGTLFGTEDGHVKTRILEIFRLALQESNGDGRIHSNDQPWPI